jgi:hypothetical protein
MYVKNQHAAMKQKNPGVHNSEILRLLASQWMTDPNIAAPSVAKADSIKAEMLAKRSIIAQAPEGDKNGPEWRR